MQIKIEKDPKSPSFFQVIVSVLAAFFGVQSQKARERDFQYGHAWWVYFGVGIILAIMLIGSLIALAKWIVLKAG